MIKQNYLKNKKKKMAVLYIQPVEYDNAGLTANVHQSSPMRPSPFPDQYILDQSILFDNLQFVDQTTSPLKSLDNNSPQ